MKKTVFNLKRFDWILFTAVICIISDGLIVQYSLSLFQDNFFYFYRQLIFTGIGLGLFFLLIHLDYHFFRSYTYWFYLLALFLLVLTLIFGKNYRGVKGWLSFGGINFQTVELVKFVLIIMLADFWTKYCRKIFPIWRVVLSACLVCLPLLLVLKQPDMGSGILLVILWGIMFLLINRRAKLVLVISVLVIILLTVSWFFVLRSYQQQRILTFLGLRSDPMGIGWQVNQSLIAVGSGEFLGKGLGQGTQSQLNFLPAVRTDFILSAFAEQFGFLGCSFLIIALLTILYRFIRIARQSKDQFGLFLILGICIVFFTQVFINFAMNVSLFPIIGISFPLMSYGGSSLIITFVLLAVAENIYQFNHL